MEKGHGDPWTQVRDATELASSQLRGQGRAKKHCGCLGNSGDRSALDALIETAAEPTKRDPLITEHVQ